MNQTQKIVTSVTLEGRLAQFINELHAKFPKATKAKLLSAVCGVGFNNLENRSDTEIQTQISNQLLK